MLAELVAHSQAGKHGRQPTAAARVAAPCAGCCMAPQQARIHCAPPSPPGRLAVEKAWAHSGWRRPRSLSGFSPVMISQSTTP